MTGSRPKPNINAAVSTLRAMAWAVGDGELLGSEEDLTRVLGVSRPTVRQVARLLEREGILRVRRGINGGYFAARPSVEIIEASVRSYLNLVVPEGEDISEIASALWVLVVRKATSRKSAQIQELMQALHARVTALPDDAGFNDVVALDEAIRREIFKVVNSPYIELILHINRTFAMGGLSVTPADRDESPDHARFVRDWKRARLMELAAISDGDAVLAEMAARHTRNLYHDRIWGAGPRSVDSGRRPTLD